MVLAGVFPRSEKHLRQAKRKDQLPLSSGYQAMKATDAGVEVATTDPGGVQWGRGGASGGAAGEALSYTDRRGSITFNRSKG
jgi:hypothetical protein